MTHHVLARLSALTLTLLCTVLISGCANPAHTPSVSSTPPTLDGATVDEWCARLEPDAAARAWQAIPWLPTYHEGAAAAAKAGKPLLLWLMNGHPLGCT